MMMMWRNCLQIWATDGLTIGAIHRFLSIGRDLVINGFVGLQIGQGSVDLRGQGSCS